jgi:hypothetical protein
MFQGPVTPLLAAEADKMSELWGFQAGQSMRRQEDMQQSLAEMSLRRGEAELMQADVALTSSQIALDSQKKMMELMRGQDAQRQDRETQAPIGGGALESEQIPDSLDELAKLAMQSGLPQQATEYASKASTIRNNASEIRKRELDSKMNELNLASNLLSTVGDEQSWRRANSLFSMQTGKPSPFAEMEYSPELVAMIQDSVVTQKDQALIRAADARTAASTAAAQASEAMVPLRKAQERLANTRSESLRKAGAVGKQPLAEDLRAVSDLINAEYLGAVTPEDARILARPVAERMMQLQSELGLPRSQAARRAFNEANARGDFGGLRARTRMKGDAQNPLEMPSTQDALRPNMFYQGKGKYAGKTLLWTGTGFRLATDAEVAAQAGSAGAAKKGLRRGEDEPFDNEHTEGDESEY